MDFIITKQSKLPSFIDRLFVYVFTNEIFITNWFHEFYEKESKNMNNGGCKVKQNIKMLVKKSFVEWSKFLIYLKIYYEFVKKCELY
jgi:hypothetical protein